EPVGKVYPLPRDNKNMLRFALAVIAMVMLLLFGLLFVVLIGGTAGWISFAAARLAVCIIAAVGIDKIEYATVTIACPTPDRMPGTPDRQTTQTSPASA